MYISQTHTLRSYGHFNDFMKSRPPYLIYLEFDKGPDPPNTSGCADGHTVQMNVSVTHT